jgi:membrane protease YdiL (CAAX protease family)
VSKIVRDLYLALGFGILFTIVGILANLLKHGSINLNPIVPVTGVSLIVTLILSLATSFSEELLVRGFFFTRLKEGYQSQLKALITSTLMYLFLLVPIIFTRLRLAPDALALILVTNIMLSVANTMIFSETKSLTMPILIHAFWNMAVALYL